MKHPLTKQCTWNHWLNFCQKKIKRMEKKVDSRSFRDGSVKKPYSPKALPSKKSSGISGIRREWPGTGRAVQHPTWCSRSQRHRVEELRGRCVARKFLYLWIQRTFGRIFPSRARIYYEQRILRRVFEEWKEEWWVSQREWKLCVRADCHYRYYLYDLTLRNWKTYVQWRREQRSRRLRAERHDAKRKVRRAWKSWLVYVVVRRTKLQMQITALEFRQRSILRMWWSRWRRRLGQVLVSHALHAAAMRHWALGLQLRAWSRWREQLLHRQEERQKVISAVQQHQCWQKRTSLRAWLDYVQIRRVKRQQRAMAERLHHVTLLQTCFCDWQWAWTWRQSLFARHALVEGLARRVTLRRAFTHWKHFVLLCAEEAAQCELAEDHRRHSLQRFGFQALKDNVTYAHLQRQRRNLAHQQHSIRLLRGFWNLWQSRLEQREQRELLPSLRAAWCHYRRTLLRKCIALWLQYTQRRRYKQLLQARADRHFQQSALPAAFCAWRGLWCQQQQERVLAGRAARFHRETLEKQVFSIWWQKMFQHRENRLAERMAILQADRQLLCRSWATWHQRAVACRQDREQQAVACAHHQRGRLRKAFCVWRERAQGLRTERTGQARAAALRSARLLRWAWSRWRECVALRVAEQQKLVLAARHGQRTTLCRALHKWLAYQGWVRRVLQEAKAREHRHNQQLLRWGLLRWRENTVAVAEKARKTSRAHAHYRRTLCSKVLAQWRLVATVRIYYRQREADSLREARRVLERGCLRTWFQRWRDHRQAAALQRAQLERAAQHRRRQLLLRGLVCWKAHHLACLRKWLLQRQGARLLAQRLSGACFRRWQQQLAARQQERQSTARALWFWAFSLQAKAWAVWLGFVRERRRKKARLERAVQAYHRGLLQEGAVRLLRFSAAVKARRQQLQAQQQVQAACSRHRAVCRCAELWKQKVLGPGREPQPAAHTAPSRRVTFEGLPDHAAAGAGDATLDAGRLRAPWLPGITAGLALAAGEPHLPDPSATRSTRKQPRCPRFLLESIQSQRTPGSGTLGGQGFEKIREVPWPEKPLAEQAQPAGLPQHRGPGPEWPPAPGWSPALLPPASVPCGVGAPARGPAQPTPGLPSLASSPDSHLRLPGDFAGARAGPGLGSEATDTGHTDLEAELEGIRQQLQHYQTTKQNLRSCQRQASSLRRWLELSREEPQPEEQEQQQVQRELEEVEAQIQQLAEQLQAQRQPVGACIARVQALRWALR